MARVFHKKARVFMQCTVRVIWPVYRNLGQIEGLKILSMCLFEPLKDSYMFLRHMMTYRIKCNVNDSFSNGIGVSWNA